jgi:hypothetical protein
MEHPMIEDLLAVDKKLSVADQEAVVHSARLKHFKDPHYQDLERTGSVLLAEERKVEKLFRRYWSDSSMSGSTTSNACILLIIFLEQDKEDVLWKRPFLFPSNTTGCTFTSQKYNQ